MDTKQILMNQMVKAKGDSGIVVFVKHRLVPEGQPMRGRPFGTQQEAEDAARDMLRNPSFVRAWTVSVEGIKEIDR
jgi:hypothetical protein